VPALFSRQFVFAVLLAVVSTVSALAIGELALRLLRPQARLVIEPPGFYVADPPGRYRLAPGYRGTISNRAEFSIAVRINQHGLRGPDTPPPAADQLRILTIGDSFAFGVGVAEDETFVARLAALLAADDGQAVPLNAGVPAFGVPDAVGWFERHGRELGADIVVLAIFLGNDLVDASPDREEILVVDGLLTPAESPRGLRAWLFRHSELYAAAKAILEKPALRPLRARLGLGEPWTVRILRQELAVYAQGAQQQFALAVEVTEVSLAKLAELADRDGFELVALLVPSELQVDPERWRAALSVLGAEADDYDLELPGRIFRQLLAHHGIAFVDPSRRLAREIGDGRQHYYRLDRHWTPSGHRLAAEELATALRPPSG
jgi:hypothetical protein